jgi:hypothetical protein
MCTRLRIIESRTLSPDRTKILETQRNEGNGGKLGMSETTATHVAFTKHELKATAKS